MTSTSGPTNSDSSEHSEEAASPSGSAPLSPPDSPAGSPAAPAGRTGGDSPSSGASRSTLFTLLGLAIFCVTSLFWLLPGFYDPSISTGDGAVYIVTAQNILAGEGYSYLGEPFTIRPPGFSALLVPLIAAFGVDYAALSWCIGLFGVLAVLLLFLYARPRLGLPVALAVALALWLNPGFLRSASQIMSDVPGLALMFGALLLERWSRKASPGTSDIRANLLLGLFIGFAAYVRSLNIFLIPALLCARACDAWKNGLGGRSLGNFILVRLALPTIVAFGSLLPWNVYAGGVEKSAPPDHTLFYSYSVAMWQSDMADPESPTLTASELGERVSRRTSDLLHVLGSRITDRDDNAAHRVIALIALALWLIVLIARRGTGDFLLGGIVLIIAIYFGFMNRLIIPVYALALIAVAQAIRWTVSRWLGERSGAWLTALLVLALAAADFQPTWRWDQARVRSDQFFKTCRAAERRFDENDILAADFGAHFSAELGRPVYTLRWALKRDGVPGALDLIERYGINSVILDRSTPNNVALLNHFAKANVPVLAEIGPFVLVDLEP